MSAKGGIVVTGASTGIGRACALDLVKRGFHVFAGVRQESAGTSLEEESGHQLTPLILDITNEEQLRQAVQTVTDALENQPLQGLVNNAGITVHGPLEFVPVADLRRQLEVNVVAQLAVTQGFLPLLRRSRGRVVLMGSVSGLLAVPGFGPYSMSKYALEAMADVLRLELSPWEIQVALIQPGAIDTPIWEKGFSHWDRFEQTAPAAMQELYDAQIKSIRGVAKHSQSQAQTAQVVADAVVHALTSSRPRSRYVVGGGAGQQKILSKLPDSWRDRLLRKMMRF
jgi:NAD(P)-dependent dehydrogenase (short-subunit alcohol dehydrogenase family)